MELYQFLEMKIVLFAMRLFLIGVVMMCTAGAFAQDPGQPVPVPVVWVLWNDALEADAELVQGMPPLLVVSHKIVDGETGGHSFTFVVTDAWPREMTWEARMPESTAEVPRKMQIVLKLASLPASNPAGQWWGKMQIQIALRIWEGTPDELTGEKSEVSDVVWVADWVAKKTGKPRKTSQAGVNSSEEDVNSSSLGGNDEVEL